MPKRILLVDDDPSALESTRKILVQAGMEVNTANEGQEGLEALKREHAVRTFPFDLVLTDVRMPKLGGMEFLQEAQKLAPTMPFVLMTAFGRIEDAVWAMKLGAVDFLIKPFNRQALLSAVDAAMRRSLVREVKSEDSQLELLGISSAIVETRDLISRVASTGASVLLSGESGTGKELAARSIHKQSPRSKKSFVALNCAALPEPLIESELFGHERGAFTGASGAKLGLFEAAHEGTLLLDEIGDMPIRLQGRLLRVIEEGEVRRLGALHTKKIDVRVISSSHRDLGEAVKQGLFRQDLLFRLEVVKIELPPLRDRREDIRVLAERFLTVSNARHSKRVTHFSPDSIDALMAHSWPGNVRELWNAVERAVIFSRGPQITASDLPLSVIGTERLHSRSLSGNIPIPLGTSLREVEDLLIRKTLEATDGDKTAAARILGVNSRTIYRRLEETKDPTESGLPG